MGKLLDISKRRKLGKYNKNRLKSIEERRNKYRHIPANKDVFEALKELRFKVENQGTTTIRLTGGTYKADALDKVHMACVPPWEFGYKVEPVSALQPNMFRRTIFIKLPGEDILGVPDKQKDAIMNAVFEALVDQECELPEFALIARDCIRMTQEFMIVFWQQGNSVVVPQGRAKTWTP